MAPNETDVIDEAAQPTDAEMARGMQIIMQAEARRRAAHRETEIKGFYVDWLFKKLNLTEHR